MRCCSKSIFFFHIFTPPRNRGGAIFSLQFVCLSVCVCLCVCVSVSVNKIPAERMHQFGCGFRLTVAYSTSSDPIEIGDLRSKIKITVTENVSKNDEKFR